VQLKDVEQALDLARKAISRNDEVNFHDTLAAAYAETGRFADAAAEQDRAIAMLRAAGMTDAVADFQSRRDFYRQRRPYRD
jgi:tetratricopeptide (TPR) repeat protein